ncbi:M48 family metallopeptidase [Agarilytica rhodophyticola]|uniref:M48 family metallopeptidase n=1 Tax=Agarilytica rhodophyticola TaxID=1737490 RepID=UPI000B342E48|nr:SprT family zinc-dependent metalloprotease [Agarilytica rhodophyticola]
MNIQGISVEVIRKKMKNLRLVVKPPHGEVRVSAPLRANNADIHSFVSSNVEWIREQQARISNTEYPAQLQYKNGEIHRYWGVDKTLILMPCTHLNSSFSKRVVVDGDSILLYAPKDASMQQRQKCLDNFYRRELEKKIPPLITKYQPILGVSINEWRIKNMKTRWGSCNITAKRIWLNLALACYRENCLEYVVVHELAHLLERYHNRRFWQIVESCYPTWREANQLLNHH